MTRRLGETYFALREGVLKIIWIFKTYKKTKDVGSLMYKLLWNKDHEDHMMRFYK